MTERRLFVYIDLAGTPHLAGMLWARNARGRESASFEYAPEWLASPHRFALDPALIIGRGAQHTLPGRKLFGALGDSAPDRWGRVLLQRAERLRARSAQAAPRTLCEIDFLIGVGDLARQGALRFAENAGGPFLAQEAVGQIPPLVALPELLSAVLRYTADEESREDLRLLLAPGSSLGGARPKASLIDRDGALAIAKFPRHDDEIRTEAWEALALTLAAKAGLSVPAWRLEAIGNKAVLVVQRFDRDGARRIPFLSAMSMLSAADNENHSYLEIADALRRHGAKANDDCIQLWRRIVFNILISNCDDHLRNHAFLYADGGWRLSPAYDLNPVPIDVRPRVLSTSIDEVDGTASLDLACAVAGHFGLKPKAAAAIIAEVAKAVSGWRTDAKAIGLSPREIERMESAFEHEESARAG